MTDELALLYVVALMATAPVVAFGVHFGRQRIKRMVISLVAAVFYGPGYVAGALVRFARWARAAIVAGYKHGRGAT